MNIVQPHLPDARVLDLFAGSGALGLEALSRGAASVEFVDNAPSSLKLLRENTDLLGAGAAAVITRGDALQVAREAAARPFDVAFADPPYRQGLATQLATQWLAAPFAHVLGIEHESAEELPQPADTRRYGTTAITFYRMPETT